MSKNVAVFVDVANIFYAAKAAGVDIDYVTLLKSATAGRDFIRAYAYTGLDPENENQRQFQAFLARNGYKVVSKDIRKYGDGKVKANLDIELVVDLMKTARNVDIAVVVSGDGDFAPAIRAVQEMGVRVEVISFRGNTSSDLIDVADQFTDITQLAKVERSGRSGRRVAASEADLSMTAVPDKESEGAPRRRRRTTKVSTEEPAQVAAAASEAPAAARSSSAARAAARSAAEALVAAGVTSLRVLPGERLSRAATSVDGAAAGTAEAAATMVPAPETAGENAPASGGERELAEREGDGRRRRRRRGGRGRGRGRGREREVMPVGESGAEPLEGEEAAAGTVYGTTPPYAPFRPPQSTFGSVWDSQLGMNTPTRQLAEPPSEGGSEEEIEEPEIPEYLLAERRRGPGGRAGRGRGGRGRGGRGAYAAALDRERFGRPSSMPAGSWSPERGPRPARGPGQVRRPARPGGYERTPSDEPWSEVPPEVEELIRAQLAGARPAVPASTSAAPVGEPRAERARSEPPAAGPAEGAAEVASAPEATSRRRPPRRRPTASASEAAPTASDGEAGGPATAPRRGRRSGTAIRSTAQATAEPAEGATPRTRSRARRSPDGDAGAAAVPVESATETPKRRSRTRKTA